MCNLGQGIEDRVTAKKIIDFVMNMYKNKFQSPLIRV